MENEVSRRIPRGKERRRSELVEVGPGVVVERDIRGKISSEEGVSLKRESVVGLLDCGRN